MKEIAYQLRLRNIGGIIIIDFIDMELESHREEMFNALKEAVKKDKNRINILKVSEFGLVQMTRKRTREDLSHMMSEPCFYCNGDGILKSCRTVCHEIFQRISRNAKKMVGSKVTINVHPRVASMMLKDETETIHMLEDAISKGICVGPSKDLHLEKYEIFWGDK